MTYYVLHRQSVDASHRGTVAITVALDPVRALNGETVTDGIAHEKHGWLTYCHGAYQTWSEAVAAVEARFSRLRPLGVPDQRGGVWQGTPRKLALQAAA